jgi:hypothetical protein
MQLQLRNKKTNSRRNCQFLDKKVVNKIRMAGKRVGGRGAGFPGEFV